MHNSVTAAYPRREELLRDWEFFVQPPPSRFGHTAAATAGDENDALLTAGRLDGRTTELEDEVARLKTQLARAKGINDVMWETFMQNVEPQGKDHSKMPAPGQIPDSHEEDTDGRGGRGRGRGRKRGKTKA
jgi:pre-rRNA-processing protein IPI3